MTPTCFHDTGKESVFKQEEAKVSQLWKNGVEVAFL